MADKSPIPGSRLEGVFSKKRKTDQPENMSHDSQTHESQSHDMQSQDTSFMSHESDNLESDNHESEVMIHGLGPLGIDPKILEWAITKGCEDPRISGYSEFAVSVLRYLRKTTPEFSMSGAASSLLEEALRTKYPELSARVTEEMEKRG